MSDQLFDIVALDTELGTLAAAGILAKKGLRILLLSHRVGEETYRLGGFLFGRRPFILHGLESPIGDRLIDELGMAQILKLHTTELSPSYQVILGRERIAVDPDPEFQRAELGRVFRNEERRIGLFYDRLHRYDTEIDKLFQNELVIPPQSMAERREFQRASVQNPFDGPGDRLDLLSDFGPGHPFRVFVEAQVRIAGATGLRSIGAFRMARLHGSWLRGTRLVEGGLDGFRKLLIDRITLFGGTLQPDRQAEELVVRRGKTMGVRMGGEEDFLGTRFIITSLPSTRLLLLVRPTDRPARFSQRPSRSAPGVWRYVLNLGLKRWAVPEGMGANVVQVADPKAPLSAENLLWITRVPQDDPERAALCVACDLPEPYNARLVRSGELRDRLLDRVRRVVPFLDEGLELVHSPWDGLPPAVIGREAKLSYRSSPGFSEEEARIPGPLSGGGLGIEGLPHRTGIGKLLAAGLDVIPGLGIEGEILSGLGLAHILLRAEALRIPMVERVLEKLDL